MPLVLDSPNSNPVSVKEVQTTSNPVQPKVIEKEEPTAEEQTPNVFLTTQKSTMKVDCGENITGEGKKVEILLEKPQTCSVSFDETTAKVKLNPDERYFCFFDNESFCRTEKEHQEVEAEKAKNRS